jgi:hypothetical protein
VRNAASSGQPSSGGPPASASAATAVERAVAGLAELDGRPLTEHVAVLDDVHHALQDALATLDEA